jgi:hypothetical protein
MAENEVPFCAPDTPAKTRAWIKAMMLSVPLPVAVACRGAWKPRRAGRTGAKRLPETSKLVVLRPLLRCAKALE